MWRGPVGLAETNSTLTCRGWSARVRPQAPGFARMPATSSSRAPSARRMLRKPGGATSTDASRLPAVPASVASSAAIASAIRGGAIRYGRASFMGRLVARSPCSGLAGRSISTGGSVHAIRRCGRQRARGDGAVPGALDSQPRPRSVRDHRIGWVGGGHARSYSREGSRPPWYPPALAPARRLIFGRPSWYFGARPHQYRPVRRCAAGASGWVSYGYVQIRPVPSAAHSLIRCGRTDQRPVLVGRDGSSQGTAGASVSRPVPAGTSWRRSRSQLQQGEMEATRCLGDSRPR